MLQTVVVHPNFSGEEKRLLTLNGKHTIAKVHINGRCSNHSTLFKFCGFSSDETNDLHGEIGWRHAELSGIYLPFYIWLTYQCSGRRLPLRQTVICSDFFPGAHSGSVCRQVCRSGVYTSSYIMWMIGVVSAGAQGWFCLHLSAVCTHSVFKSDRNKVTPHTWPVKLSKRLAVIIQSVQINMFIQLCVGFVLAAF